MASSDIFLVGATGLVGSAVARLTGATILARRAPADTGTRQPVIVAPGDRWAAIIADHRPATLISCLGTTIRQAGSQSAFRAVDRDLLLECAGAAKAAGTRHLIAVSSVGASSKARNFYLRTKGEAEDGLRALGFDRLDLLRPGLLTGNRRGPPRLGEGMAMIAAPLTDALLHGGLRRFRSIPAETVARAIAELTGRTASGVHLHENDAIRTLAD